MASNGWRSLPFGEAVEINPSVPLERGKAYPFVDMQAVNPSSRAVGPSEYREFEGGGARFATGDTLMARITPCLENGKIAQFHVELEHAVGHGSTEFIVIRGRDGVTDNDFVYYLTRWDGVRGYAISQMTGSSGRQRVPTEALASLEVTIPPLPEQRAIAHILGTLDDKIDLNRRMNETLEAMAHALFKSWFVDFDPVRAKAEGRDPGLPKPIADLFPDRFENSELGRIPMGWNVGPLLEQAQLLSGGTPKTDQPEYWNGSIPWASAKDISRCGKCFLISTERTITKLGLQESATQIIQALSTVVVARGATTGRMTMFGADIAMNQTCYALCSSLGCSFALYCQARQVMDDLVQTAHGSVFDTITTSTFQASKVVLPPRDALHRFERTSEPLFRQILAKEYESESLAAIRDALLPKLLCGELRVKDAERFVVEAGA